MRPRCNQDYEGVLGEGFEPSKAEPTVLQTALVVHLSILAK